MIAAATTPDFAAAARKMAVLAGPLRLRLLWELRDGELYLGQVAGRLGVSQPHASYVARKLRIHRLIDRDPRGRRRFYRLTEEGRAALRRAGLID
jgi:DNA-binding transcriptional ArsR family regulator